MILHDVLDFCARHHGLVRLGDALELGATPRQMHGWVERGLLVLEGNNVFRARGSGRTWRQHVLRDVWTAGTAARASHHTAAAIWGLRDGRAIEVVVPKGTGGRARPRAVHETRHLTGVDVDERDGIPVTSAERTLVDLARVMDMGALARSLDTAHRAGVTTYRRTAERLRTMPTRGRKGVPILRALLEERVGSDLEEPNPFEALMDRMLRRSDLPPHTRQERVEQNGRHYFVDFAFPSYRVAVECDGLLGHGSPAAQAYDLARQNDIMEAGWDLRRFGWSAVRTDPTGTVSTIRRALLAHGWTPTPTN